MNIILHNEHRNLKKAHRKHEGSHCQGRNQAMVAALVPADEYAFNAQENTTLIE